MKSANFFLAALIICCTALCAQPRMMSTAGPDNLKKALNLTESQTAKVDKIFKDLKQQTDMLREKESGIIKKFRDSTRTVLEKSHDEIVKVLNKDQTEKFKKLTAEMKDCGMMPPPPDAPQINFFPEPGEDIPQQPMFKRERGRRLGDNNFEPPCMQRNQPCYDHGSALNELNCLDMLLGPPASPDSIKNK